MQVETPKSDLVSGVEWQNFLKKAVLSLACLLLASAAISWVAANWAHATAFQKLAGTQGVLVALVLMSWRLMIGTRAGEARQFSLTANMVGLAAVTTGGLLALIGQIYQTGADPWELFLLWAVLLMPWLLIIRTVFLAMLCAVLLNTAAALYLDVFGARLWFVFLPSWMALSLLLALLNLTLLFAWECGIGWLDDRWRIGPRSLGAAAFAWLVAASMAALSTPSSWATIVPGMIATALVAWIYVHKRPDLAMVCLAALTAFCLLAISLINWLDSVEGLLLVIMILLALAGFGLRYLGAAVRLQWPTLGQELGAVRVLQEPWFLSLLRLAVLVIMVGLTTAFLALSLDLRLGWLWIVGLSVGAGGLWMSRAHDNGVLHETGLALMATGLLLISIDLFSMDELHTSIRVAGILLTGGLVYAFSTSAALRFFCVICVLSLILALTWPTQNPYGLLDDFDADTLQISIPLTLRLWWLAVAAVLTLVLGARSRNTALWMPLAWGLVCLTQLLAWMAPAPTLFWLSDSWHPALTVIWLACAVLPVLLLAVFLWQQADTTNALRFGAPLVLAVASLGWMGAPGIAMALVWIILGYGLAQRSLLAFGVLALLAYLARFYYLLDSSLLQKSWILGLTGAWLLLAWFGLRQIIRRSTPPRQHVVSGAQPQRRLWHEAGLAIGLLLILLVANTGIYQREQILATGQQVILALAPVDPRSLIQGDYMALNFELGNQVSSALRHAPEDLANQIESQGGGYLVLQPDEQGIHQLVALKADIDKPDANEASDAVALEFRLRNQRVRIVTDAWFFPEGQAERYEHARYGEFRVDDKGQGLLTHMLDAQHQVLP